MTHRRYEEPDYAELLVAEAFGGRIAKASEKSWDVRIDERLLQVKCRVTDASSTKSQTRHTLHFEASNSTVVSSSYWIW